MRKAALGNWTHETELQKAATACRKLWTPNCHPRLCSFFRPLMLRSSFAKLFDGTGPTILALRRLRLEDQEFEASLSYRARPYLKNLNS